MKLGSMISVDALADHSMVRIGALSPGNVNSVFSNSEHGIYDSGPWDRECVKLKDTDVYTALQAFILESKPIAESSFYERVLKEINGGKSKWGCKTEAHWRKRVEVTIPLLVDSIDRQGVLSAEEWANTQPLGRQFDDIRVAATRDGQILILDGRHRASIARILALKSYPARLVLCHDDFSKSSGNHS